jgi:hypothetical protein
MIRKGALNIYRNKVNAYSHLLCARVMGVSSLDKEIFTTVRIRRRDRKRLEDIALITKTPPYKTEAAWEVLSRLLDAHQVSLLEEKEDGTKI